MTNQNHEARRKAVVDRIESACLDSGRDPGEVRLLAVSKKQPIEAIRALQRCGQHAFGESYVDEALEKIAALAEPRPEWHFIGPIQSNKTRAIAGHFDWVHSIDRAKAIRRLADQRPADRGPLNVLIQVNLDDETGKAGCAPESIDELAGLVAERPELALRGLMAIPAERHSRADQLGVFERLREYFDQLAAGHPGIDTLSAGMSGDLEAAIAAGSNLVRVGTALFGPRE